MENVLEIQNLVKKYKNGRGVNDISFSLREGEVVGLLGPNGSGKTTIMKCIVGFRRYQAGEIFLFGKDVLRNREELMSRVGALIEQPALYENITAKRQLKMMSRFYSGITEEYLEGLLKDAGLERYANEKIRRYSLGMKQRMGIALAMLGDPSLIILDEPGNGLDIESTVDLRNGIVKKAKERGCSFLISSHQADDLEKICDRVLILSDGELLEDVLMENALRRSPSLEEYFLSVVRNRKNGLLRKEGEDLC